jgi:serine/threonine protein kinase
LDEAHAASRLNHPHVCTIHGVFELDGRSNIVMEFVAGRLLKEYIHRDGLPTATVLAYGARSLPR